MNIQVALRLGRVSNLPTVWTNVLAGLTLAGAGASAAQIAALMISMTFFYLGGMYLNDAFDAKIDAAERPDRPIPSGQVSARTVFCLGFAMLALGIIGLACAGTRLPDGIGWAPAIAGLLLAACIVFYDWHHKNNPLGPLVMGACRMLVYIAAGLVITTALPNGLYFGAAVLLCYLIGLTFAAKQENLNQITNLWPLIFLGVPFAYVAGVLEVDRTSMLILAAFLLWVLYALSFLVFPARINVSRAVISLLAGICLLDALLIAASGETNLALFALIGFPLTLAFQRWIPGT
ncbi:MAG: UbiA family prenyltransferase [Rhodospirillales bacterium]|jgi:4-hydroxybenzoate polyprenyltransferase|nr:UbiA family prenyltransferase [Rhodospirillales bacterium]|tara:strand:+ start:4573 stop:5445 length:873 start_codon:yes stop_codon:yes gene_type:complete